MVTGPGAQVYGKDFSGVLSLARAAHSAPAGSTGDAPVPPPAGNTGAPGRRDRYNVEASDAFKAAGMDQLLLQADPPPPPFVLSGHAASHPVLIGHAASLTPY